ncbi:MAG: LacI family DNA-binding transcriptional regulator, partial [Nocardioidaceae bacterium]|nr:LacI family DNA-binding transcriptional regulator [Nocardioidaceae bacterium]
MSATIRDVAQAAGVSPATVSRVLNGKVEVAEELSRRVREQVELLGYRPNGLARSLRMRATQVLGVVISDVTNPFFTSMVRGIEDQAQQAGYSVVLANSDEDLDKERRYLEVAAAEQMAGVVLSPSSSRRTDVSVLQRHGIPVVTVDRQLHATPVDSILI